MARNNYGYDSKITKFWISPLVNSKVGIDIAMLFTRRESRRTSDSALLRVRSKELRLHPQSPWFWSPPAFATLGSSRWISAAAVRWGKCRGWHCFSIESLVLWARSEINVSALEDCFDKTQIPSNKFQINLKFQYSMTETVQHEKLFRFSNLGHCLIFVIWYL